MAIEENGNVDNNLSVENIIINDSEVNKWYSKIWEFAKKHPEIFTFLSGLIIAFVMFWINLLQDEVIKHYFRLHNIPEYYVSESKFEFYRLILDILKMIPLVILGGSYIYISDFLFYKQSKNQEDKPFIVVWWMVVLIIFLFLVNLIQIGLFIMCILIVVYVFFYWLFRKKGKYTLFLLKILILLIVKMLYSGVVVLILLGTLIEKNICLLFELIVKDSVNFVVITVLIFVILEALIFIKRIYIVSPNTVKPRKTDNKKGYNWFCRTIVSFIYLTIPMFFWIIFIQLENPSMRFSDFIKDSYNLFRIENKTYISLYKHESNIFAKEIDFLECANNKNNQVQCEFEFKDNKLKIFEHSTKEIEYKYTNIKYSRDEIQSNYSKYFDRNNHLRKKIEFIDMNP